MEQEDNISIQLLREQNHQLKNEISEMKNAFDLNRDILAILSNQQKTNSVDIRIFYQIIRRLTSLNNQTMLVFGDLVSEKSKMKAQNLQLKRQNQQLSQSLEQAINSSKQFYKIRQIHLEMRQQRALLRKELLNMNQQLVLKSQDIKKLKKKLQQKVSEMAPIGLISTSTQDTIENQITVHKSRQVDKSVKQNLQIQYLKKKNHQLEQYIQQLQGRITLLTKCVQLQSKSPQQNKPQKDLLLSLLNYAIQNMNLGTIDTQQDTKDKVKIKHLRNINKTQRKKGLSKSLDKFL